MKIEDNSFFAPFSPGARQRLIQISTQSVYPDGTSVFNENDPPNDIFLVLSGSVELIKKTSAGQVEVLARVHMGDFFGEMGVIDGGGRSAGARTIGETTLARIPGYPLVEHMKTEPGNVSLYFLRRMSENLRNTNVRFVTEVVRKEKLHVVGEMAGSIVHDLKNPMTSIQLATELIGRQHEDELTGACCETIHKQVDRMVSMVQGIMDYVKGPIELAREIVPVAELFASLAHLNEAYLQEKKITLTIQPVDLTLQADKDRLVRVLQALLNNAVSAMKTPGGTITLDAEKSGDKHIEIYVEDNGPGIPENIRENIFEPFVSTGLTQGPGLGMAIARKIVEAHGGTLTFITETGKGTTFTVRLPVER